MKNIFTNLKSKYQDNEAVVLLVGGYTIAFLMAVASVLTINDWKM